MLHKSFQLFQDILDLLKILSTLLTSTIMKSIYQNFLSNSIKYEDSNLKLKESCSEDLPISKRKVALQFHVKLTKTFFIHICRRQHTIVVFLHFMKTCQLWRPLLSSYAKGKSKNIEYRSKPLETVSFSSSERLLTSGFDIHDVKNVLLFSLFSCEYN